MINIWVSLVISLPPFEKACMPVENMMYNTSSGLFMIIDII